MNFKPKIPEYVKTNRFIIKLFQIFCGLIVHSSIGCLKWEGLCFKEDRNNIVAMINFCIILLNTSLYVVAIGFRQWYVIKIYKSAVSIYDPITMYICFIIFFFIWEYLIITKRALNNEGERKNNCNIINGKKNITINIKYSHGKRALIKLLQIIFGIIIFGVSALYSTSYNLSGLLFFVFNVNLIFIIINIGIVVRNYFNGAYYKFEKIYSIVGMVLSNICFLFMICFLIANHDILRHSRVENISMLIGSTHLSGIMTVLYLVDFIIMKKKLEN
uniref:Uncharacterized protein n=1 Tax=Meloidogyne enterolobii TaxID=390850 RepID=A0A6V7W7L4_MELEN|nr:unnamed protein product [Meloidogyne enterolobii]